MVINGIEMKRCGYFAFGCPFIMISSYARNCIKLSDLFNESQNQTK